MTSMVSKLKEIKGVLSENRGNTVLAMITILLVSFIALGIAELVIGKTISVHTMMGAIVFILAGVFMVDLFSGMVEGASRSA